MHKWLAGLVAVLVVAAVVWAAEFRTTTIYQFDNGLETDSISSRTGTTGDAALDVPDQSINTSELTDGAVTFAKQAHVTIGAAPAATCTAGDIHIDTDETDDTVLTTTADNSLGLCVATDTWVVLENN